jgi:hypothetical protein
MVVFNALFDANITIYSDWSIGISNIVAYYPGNVLKILIFNSAIRNSSKTYVYSLVLALTRHWWTIQVIIYMLSE